MTVNSRVIKTFLQWSPDAVDVPLMNGLRIQILPTIEDLPRARKHQFAAFIASDALLVVWDDEALHLIQRAKAIESELMELVWRTGEPEEVEEGQMKKGANVAEVEIDSESGEIIPEKRATHLLNTILVACTLVLIVTVLGAGFREIAIEVAVDHNMIRLAFLALTPVQIFFTLVCLLSVDGLWLHIFTADTYRRSSSLKSSSVASLNASVQSARCTPTRNTTPPNVHRGCKIASFLMSPSNVPCTRRVWHLSLHQQSNLSSRLSPHTNCKVAPPICSSTTTVFRSSTKRSDVLVLNFMPITLSDGLLVPSTVPMVSSERANSRRYVAILYSARLRLSFIGTTTILTHVCVSSYVVGQSSNCCVNRRAGVWAIAIPLLGGVQ